MKRFYFTDNSMEGTHQGSYGPLRDHGLGEYDKAALFLKFGDLIQQEILFLFPAQALHLRRAPFFCLLSWKVASLRRDKNQ